MNKKTLFLLGTGATVGYVVAKHGDKIIAAIKEHANNESFEKLLKDLEQRQDLCVKGIKDSVKSKEETVVSGFTFEEKVEVNSEEVELEDEDSLYLSKEVETPDVSMNTVEEEDEELKAIEEEIKRLEAEDKKE